MSARYNCWCYCYTCQREINSYGIARHRMMHKTKKENCRIQYSNGDVYRHDYGMPSVKPSGDANA